MQTGRITLDDLMDPALFAFNTILGGLPYIYSIIYSKYPRNPILVMKAPISLARRFLSRREAFRLRV